MHRVCSRGVATLFLLGLCGCGGGDDSPGGPTGPDPNAVAQVRLSVTDVSLSVGDSLQLIATATNASGDTLSVSFTWTTDNPQVAVVSPNGLVTAVGEGTANVSARAGTVSSSVEIRAAYVLAVFWFADGGKNLSHLAFFLTYSIGPWQTVDLATRPAYSQGTRVRPRRRVGPSPASARLPEPNVTATQAFFAGGFGPDGAGAGDQALFLDWPSRTATDVTMSVPRSGHTLTALLDGRFLIAGGRGASFVEWSSAELFDPDATHISLTGSMSVSRSDHAAALLADGRVLVTGGSDGTGGPGRSSTEIYDPATGQFTTGPNMTAPRRLHTATSLLDGRVLVVGGQGIGAAEIYDPALNQFSPLPDPAGVHGKWHTATLLLDGRVLIAGGDSHPGGLGTPTALAEVFDPSSMTFSQVGAMHTVRMLHSAVLGEDGRVLIGGGIDESEFPTAEAEFFDPASDSFTLVPDMPRVGAGQAAVFLTAPGS